MREIRPRQAAASSAEGYDPVLDAPHRPGWVGLVAPLAGWVTGAVAATALALALAPVGGGALPTAAALAVLSIGFVVGAVLVARRYAPVDLVELGFDDFRPAETASWAAVVLIPALALAWAGLDGEVLSEALPPPSALVEPGIELAFGEEAPTVPFGLGVAAMAIALVVLPAIAAELVIRGLVLSALVRSSGVLLAVALTALLTAAPFGLVLGDEGSSVVAGTAVIAGAGLSLAYLRTGSAYPGVAALSIGLAATLGASLGWSVAGVAVLAALSTGLALTLATGAAAAMRP